MRSFIVAALTTIASIVATASPAEASSYASGFRFCFPTQTIAVAVTASGKVTVQVGDDAYEVPGGVNAPTRYIMIRTDHHLASWSIASNGGQLFVPHAFCQ